MDYLWPYNSQYRNPLKKRFLWENVIFQGLRFSLGHFGQQAPEIPVSQLRNGVSTSSLPLTSFHCGLNDILRLPKVQLVFSLGILEGAKRQTSRAAYNGPKQQCYVKRQKQISPKNGGRNFVWFLSAPKKEVISCPSESVVQAQGIMIAMILWRWTVKKTNFWWFFI